MVASSSTFALDLLVEKKVGQQTTHVIEHVSGNKNGTCAHGDHKPATAASSTAPSIGHQGSQINTQITSTDEEVIDQLATAHLP
ncbi:hypothetical protein GCM10007877_06810 [Marinibactrum halimedae]|uniref:Uncharacterized protein n=2 Tax=Marinibactrum halimedae TaxID=1444977 RepID=A0AA37WNE6_9GAMM|nr:hypothetical protein GCM10007877_06810 [Marinibactrum halimedae]